MNLITNTRQKFYVITPFFNPHGFQSRVRLYQQFAKHIAASGAELLTIEGAFDERPFEVTSPGDLWDIQVRTNQILWHKERMINVARNRLRELVPDARFFGWFDADVTLANPDWVAETIHRLMHTPIVQPFATAVNLDSSENYMWNCPSAMRSFLEGRGFHQEPPIKPSYIYKGHPGLAWAADMEVIDSLGGLYDTCIAGSADTVMANAFRGDWSMYLPAPPSPGMVQSMKRWASRCDQCLKAKVGFTRGVILHHWHGRSETRGYEKRWSILSFHQFDPHEDIHPDGNGLYKWAGNKPQLEDDIRLSLGSRNEDEI